MKEFTKEQLIKKAQEQIAFCRHTKITGEGRAHVNQCAALFEIALAALTAEPVSWTDEVELRDVEANGFAYLFTVNPITPHADPRRIIKLYKVQPAMESRTVTAAASDVLAERQRQISAEGWSTEHDDEHAPGQLSDAGGCYALNAFEDGKTREGYEPDWWPWERHWYKPGTPRRDLVKAAALIIAEIEHLDRSNDDE